MEAAPPPVPTPQYLLWPTRDHLAWESQARPSIESINNVMIHMFQVKNGTGNQWVPAGIHSDQLVALFCVIKMH